MISTHILDTSVGNPAVGVSLVLEKKVNGEWKELKRGSTNQDGRFTFDVSYDTGDYRILFQTNDYFKKLKTDSFFDNIPVVFRISDASRKYHVPLLLNPYGYSTYRGS